MNFPPNTLRWLPVVLSEIQRGGYPFPPELVLAVIWTESRGTVGDINQNSGASGLMQIMPNTLGGYNENNSQNISLQTLRSSNPSAAPKQIRVGLWVMGRYLTNAYKWITQTNERPQLEDLVRISDLMYVAGPGRVRRKFHEVTDRTFSNLVDFAPAWQAFDHPNNVWRWTEEENDPQWNLASIDAWVSGAAPILPPQDPISPIHTPKGGFMIALAMIGLASFFLKNTSK